MNSKVNFRFVNYIYGNKKTPEKSERAIADRECMEIAREIIAREDSFWENKTINEKDDIIQHYEDMKNFFVKNFGSSSCFVESVQNEINVMQTGLRKIDARAHSYNDDILRIRAVFDLYGEL